MCRPSASLPLAKGGANASGTILTPQAESTPGPKTGDVAQSPVDASELRGDSPQASFAFNLEASHPFAHFAAYATASSRASKPARSPLVFACP
ncbi:hypothetical protein EMIT0111MI5_10746 [Burkholderia sp. IT-111MI5]